MRGWSVTGVQTCALPICGRTRDGRFVVKRKTQSKRLTVKLKALRVEARRRMHAPVSEQHRWLCQVLRGHYAYYGLSANFRCLKRSEERRVGKEGGTRRG